MYVSCMFYQFYVNYYVFFVKQHKEADEFVKMRIHPPQINCQEKSTAVRLVRSRPVPVILLIS